MEIFTARLRFSDAKGKMHAQANFE